MQGEFRRLRVRGAWYSAMCSSQGGLDLLRNQGQAHYCAAPTCAQGRRQDKLDEPHAPEAGCIARDWACTPYELGVKVYIAVTAKAGDMRSMAGNPYDGHPLGSQLERAGILIGQQHQIVLACHRLNSIQP
jgi:hypothetical protein